MTKPEREPHKQIMWAIINDRDPSRIYFSSTSFEYSRKDCIAEFISFGQPWQRLRKDGYRCVKVEVKEIK